MAADLVAKIGADITEFEKKLQDMVTTMEKKTKDLSAKAKKVGKSMTTNITLPIVAAGAAALAQSAKFETLETSFVSLLGSAEKARVVMQKLTDFAASTPFQLEGIGSAAKQLLAAGENADTLQPVLKTLGDIAAGANIPFSDMAAIFAKAKNKGKAMTEELMQLSDRGIPIIAVLAEKLNVSKEAIFKMASEGKISFDILKGALEDMSATGGIFADQMKVQSTTLGGIFSTLKDNVALSLGTIGDEIVKAFNLKEVMTNVIASIQKFTTAFKNLSPATKKIIILTTGFVAALGPLLVALGSLGAFVPMLASGLITLGAGFAKAALAVSQFLIALAPILLKVALVVAAVAGLATIAQFVYDNWTAFKERFGLIWSHIKNGVINSVQSIISGLDSFLSWLGVDFLNDAASSLDKFKDEIPDKEDLTPFGSFVDSFHNMKDNLIDGVKFLGDSVKTHFTPLLSALGGDIGGGTVAAPEMGTMKSVAAPEMGEMSFDSDGSLFMQLQAVNEAMDKARQNALLFGDEMSYLAERQSILKEGITALLEEGFAPNSEAVQNLVTQYKALGETSGVSMSKIQSSVNRIVDGFFSLNKEMKDSEGNVMSFSQKFGQFAKDFLIQIGKMIVKALILAAIMTLLGGGAPAAGGAAGGGSAFGSAFKAIVGAGGLPKFANGGIVSGPTLGLMGEYPGASRNPEVIAPLDKLRSMMGSTGSSVTVGGEFRLDNDVLIAAVRQGESEEDRILG